MTDIKQRFEKLIQSHAPDCAIYPENRIGHDEKHNLFCFICDSDRHEPDTSNVIHKDWCHAECDCGVEQLNADIKQLEQDVLDTLQNRGTLWRT